MYDTSQDDPEMILKSIFKHSFVNSIPQLESFHLNSTIVKLYFSLRRYKLTFFFVHQL